MKLFSSIMEKRLKEEIVKAADSIRSKYKTLKRGLLEEDFAAKKRFEPLVKPLEAIIDLTKEKDIDEGGGEEEGDVGEIKKELQVDRGDVRKSIVKPKAHTSVPVINAPGQ